MLGAPSALTIPTTLTLLESFSFFFSMSTGAESTFVAVVGDRADLVLKEEGGAKGSALVPPLSSDDLLPRGAYHQYQNRWYAATYNLRCT
jgi:hypothetical protein